MMNIWCSLSVLVHSVVIEELCEELERLSGVPVGEQILLCGPPFARLDARRAVESYGLPAVSCVLFCFFGVRGFLYARGIQFS